MFKLNNWILGDGKIDNKKINWIVIICKTLKGKAEWYDKQLIPIITIEFKVGWSESWDGKKIQKSNTIH